MGWKDWPYWLKGGIISSGIVLTIFLIAVLANGMFGQDVGSEFDILFVLIPTFYFDFTHYSSLLLDLIIYFLVGTLFGWIYGKIENIMYKNIIFGALKGLIFYLIMLVVTFVNCNILYLSCTIPSLMITVGLPRYTYTRLIVPLLVYIIFGAIIGFIYGKVKARSK